MTDDEQEQFHEGYEAQQSGDSMRDCPYSGNSPEEAEWIDGWQSADAVTR